MIDSANKRKSVQAQASGPCFGIPYAADGTTPNGNDRRHLSGLYRFDEFKLIDTANKRRSLQAQASGQWCMLAPTPDGITYNLNDRRHLSGLYRFDEVQTGEPWILPTRAVEWALQARPLGWTLQEHER